MLKIAFAAITCLALSAQEAPKPSTAGVSACICAGCPCASKGEGSKRADSTSVKAIATAESRDIPRHPAWVSDEPCNHRLESIDAHPRPSSPYLRKIGPTSYFCGVCGTFFHPKEDGFLGDLM